MSANLERMQQTFLPNRWGRATHRLTNGEVDCQPPGDNRKKRRRTSYLAGDGACFPRNAIVGIAAVVGWVWEAPGAFLLLFPSWELVRFGVRLNCWRTTSIPKQPVDRSRQSLQETQGRLSASALSWSTVVLAFQDLLESLSKHQAEVVKEWKTVRCCAIMEHRCYNNY